jgi:hypothetical protein
MPKKITAAERARHEASAYREAGHAVAAYVSSITLMPISVRAKAKGAGRNVWNDALRNVNLEWVKEQDSAALVERLSLVLLAGPIAQKTFAANLPRGDEYTRRTTSARTLLCAVDGEKKGRDRFAALTATVEQFLKKKEVKRAVQTLGAELMADGLLTGEEVARIIESALDRDAKGKKPGGR